MKQCVPVALLAFLTVSPLSAVAQAPERPNVLIIIVDDLRPEVAAYGDQIALTPNIDRFAETGVLFENVFSSVPVCGASRASMFSGRSPTTNRFIRHDSRLDRELPGVLSLPAYFKDHGYHTVSNGKVFDAQMDSADAWSEPPWNPEGEWHSDRRRNERTVHLQRAWLNDVVGENGPPYERLDVTDSAYPDGQIADKAVNDLRRLRDAESPFLLVVGFRKPHLPFTAPEEYWSMYSPEDFSLPTTYYTIPDGVPSQPIHNSFELRGYAGIPPSGLLEESQALNLIHAYHAAVSYADALIGKVLDGVSDLGLEEDTIVLLLGDHGWSLGEHTQWNKNSLFDIALRTPLIVRVPGRASSRVNAIVSLLDLFPSLTELTGLPTPGDLDGVSLVPALDDPDAAVRTAVLSRWYDGASVRSDRFRYSDWRDESGAIKARMLFDLEADPEETRNVAEESEYKSTVAELSKLITDDRSGLSWSPIVRNFVGNRDGAPGNVDVGSRLYSPNMRSTV